MKLTQENYKDYVPKKDQNLFDALLMDLLILNRLLVDQGDAYRQLYFDIETNHTSYSPERTDPCPDYYGTFTLRFENDPSEKIGPNMDLDDLDTMICGLYNFVEFQPK